MQYIATVRQALLFDLKWSICHAIQRLLRKIDYNGNFYKPVVGLIWWLWGLWEDLQSRYFVPPCQRFYQWKSFSQTNPPVATWKIEMCIPGHHIRVSCVYFGFYFHLVNFWFLGKLTTGRPWPTPWPTPWPRPWPTRGFVPTPKLSWICSGRILQACTIKSQVVFIRLPVTVSNRLNARQSEIFTEFRLKSSIKTIESIWCFFRNVN